MFVVSNQPNAAKAKASLDTLHAIHDRLMLLLGNDKIFVDHFYYCFHHPEGIVPELSGACLCRKPSPLFLFQARDHFAIDLGNSWMVGDRSSDIECGRAAGVHTIRIENAEEQNPAISEEPRPEFIVDSLAAAAAIILSQGSAWK